MSELKIEVGKFYYHAAFPSEKMICVDINKDKEYEFLFFNYEDYCIQSKWKIFIREWPPEPEQPKFKVGDAWETCAGHKVIIDAISANRIYVKQDNNFYSSRDINGIADVNPGENLVRPWVDKPKTLQVGWVYENDCGGHNFKVVAKENNLFIAFGHTCIGSELQFYNKYGENANPIKQNLNLESGRPAEEV